MNASFGVPVTHTHAMAGAAIAMIAWQRTRPGAMRSLPTLWRSVWPNVPRRPLSLRTSTTCALPSDLAAARRRRSRRLHRVMNTEGAPNITVVYVDGFRTTVREPEFLAHNAATDEKYVREITLKREAALAWCADRSGKPNAEVLRREEHQVVLNRYILGQVLRIVTPRELVQLLPKLQNLQARAKELRDVVSAMPSAWLSCEMNVQVVLAKEPAHHARFLRSRDCGASRSVHERFSDFGRWSP